MNRRLLAILAVWPVIGSGCGFAQNVRRNVVLSPMFAMTERADHRRHVNMAREAYKQMALAYPDQGFTCDYREGFVDGFADFLDYGGTGEAPPIPKPKYRLFGYATPEGYTAMEDWKNGFRHGAATARASRLRNLVTIPVNGAPSYSSDGPKPKTSEPPEPLPPPKPAANGAPEPPPAQPIEPPAGPPPEPIRPQ
jgi:hypothetical protein